MAKYKKIDARMWGDAKFQTLSQNAQFIWIYLLTGPQNTALPGLFIAGEAGLAEALGKDLKCFREGFAEILQLGMVKADWKARTLFIPNAIKYDPPQSPNVVRHWGKLFDDIPECNVKSEAYQYIKEILEQSSKAFLEAFTEAFQNLSESISNPSLNPEPLPLPLPLPLPDPNPDLIKTLSSKLDDVKKIFFYWQEELNHPQSKLDAKRTKAIKGRLKEGYTVERIMQAVRGIKKIPHNMGQNDRNTAYDDIELICRSGANVDRFADAETKKERFVGQERYENAMLTEGG